MNATNNQKTLSSTKSLVILGLLTAVMLLMSFTPLGYLNVGPLALSLNCVPMAVAAIALGPTGGAILGGVFGITSFLQCIGVGGSTSFMGAQCFAISPVLAFIQRFVPRVLAGLLTGLIFRLFAKTKLRKAGFWVAGFFAAFLNTLFFMSALVLLFGNIEYLQGLIAGRSIIVYICASVGIQAVIEWVVSTVIGGAVGFGLDCAKLIK